MLARNGSSRSRKRATQRKLQKSLMFERLEDRRLLAGVPPMAFGALPDMAESEPACNAKSQVERVSLRISTPRTIDVMFQGDMEIESMITDSSIVNSVNVLDMRQGSLSLTVDQFTFDAAQRMLSIELPDMPLSDYLELRLDGSNFLSCGGSQLVGGHSGLQFTLPVLATDTFVASLTDPIEVENYSVPSLADWNNDGLLDLIVGEKTDANEGKIRVYLNAGSAAAPAFGSPFYVQSEGADLTLAASGCLGAFPRIADWNDDGLQDLIVGRADGSVQVYVNTNTEEAPEFGAPAAIQFGEPGTKVDIQVGSRATPVPTDWNDDGRLDLLVGGFDGKVRLYINAADSGAPDFREELFVQDGGADLSVTSGRSSPAVFDFDGDGRHDLVLGDTAGQITFYRNIGTSQAPTFDGSVPVEAGGTAIDLDGTPRSRPFVADFNNDTLPDLLVGAQDGFVRLYLAQSWVNPTVPLPTYSVAGEPFHFTSSTIVHPWHNAARPSDATGDGQVDSMDIDGLFHELNTHRLHDATGAFRHLPLLPFYCDVNGDNLFTPRDILLVISTLRDPGQGEGEAEGEGEDLAYTVSEPWRRDIASAGDADSSALPISPLDTSPLDTLPIDTSPIDTSPILSWQTGAPRPSSVDSSRDTTILERSGMESLESAIDAIAAARYAE